VERGLVDLLRLLDMLAATPRWMALVSLLVFLSMLVLGLRYPRFYVCLAGAVAGLIVGVQIAASLGVNPWHVSPVVAAAGAALGFFAMRFAVPVFLALALGLGAGAGLGADLGELFAPQLRSVFFADADAAAYWMVVAGGVLIGLAAGVLFNHFCTALTSALIGALGVAGTLGSVVRASSGALSRNGYREEPLYWMIGGFILVVVSMMAQAALEPDDMAWAAEGVSDND
jgi:hypothetical protein